MVVPSSAVTVAVTVLRPVTRFRDPEITTVAPASVVLDTTVTAEVRGATSMVSPSITDAPLTVKAESVASFEKVFPSVDTNTLTE